MEYYTCLYYYGNIVSIFGDVIYTISNNAYLILFWSKKSHNEAYNAPKEDESGKLYHCLFCEKPYMSQTTLETHVKRCHTEEPENFMCETCGKRFQFKVSFQNYK